MTPAIDVINVSKVYRRYAQKKQFATLKSAILNGSLLGDLKPPDATISRVGRSFHVPRVFEPIDNARERYRFDVEHVGKLDLPQSRHSGEAQKNLPLRTSDTQRRCPPVERLAERMGGFSDLKRQIFHRCAYNKPAY